MIPQRSIRQNRRPLLLLCGVVFAAGATPAAGQERERHEDAIFAVVVDSLFSHRGARIVLVTPTRSIPGSFGRSSWRSVEEMPGSSAELLRDFEAANTSPRAISSLGPIRTNVVLVPREVFDTLPRGLSPPPSDGNRSIDVLREALQNRYSGASSIVILTRPGFDSAMNQAVLQIDYYCGALCGAGQFVTLKRDGDAWRIVAIKGVWVS